MSHNFQYSITIQFHQADPAGIMFFGHIFTLAHDAYQAFTKHLGYDYLEWFQNSKLALPIKHTSCDFFKPLKAGDHIDCQVSIVEIGNSHFKSSYEFFKEGTLHARVEMVQVGLDPQKFQKMALPEKLRDQLKHYYKNLS